MTTMQHAFLSLFTLLFAASAALGAAPRPDARGGRVTEGDASFALSVTSDAALSDIRFGEWEGTVARRIGTTSYCTFFAPDGGWPAGLTEANLVATDIVGNSTNLLFWLLNSPVPANAVTIGADGFYRVAGERFFPLMIFEVEENEMADAAAAGFDVIHNYKWEKNRSLNSVRTYLDNCSANGLRAFIGFDRGATTGEGLIQGNITWAARRVGALADHPGLFCWYLYDEPDKSGQYVSPAFLKEVADLVRALDPYHPVTLTTTRDGMDAYRSCWDTYWAQAYGTWAEGYGNPKAVNDRIDALAADLPFTVILNCTDREQTQLMQQGIEPDPSKFARDYDHLRACAFLPLAKECNGDCWWWFGRDSESFYSASQCPPAWSNMTAIVHELRFMRKYADASGTVSTGTATSGSNKVAWWLKTMADGAAFIAVNTSSNAVTASIALPGLASQSLSFRGHEVKTAYKAGAVDASIFNSAVIPITVDTDMTLSEALANAHIASLGTTGTIWKYGPGTVTVDDASGIGSFAGDIHVCEGGWSVGTAAGFGTSAGETWIDDGACVFVTDVTVAHTGETFHLAGTGKSDDHGWGAIRFPGSSQNSATMAVGAYGSRWILEGDATVLLSDNGNNGTFLPAIDLDLNGHELTLWRGRYGRISTYSSSPAKYGMFHSVTGAGGIVMKNGVTFNADRQGFKPSSYTAGNYLALQNAYLGIWETQNLHPQWGLVAKPLPESHWGYNESAAPLKPYLMLMSWGNKDHHTNHDFNRWCGPVTLEGNLNIMQENQNYANPMTFTNKVTGAGGFSVTTGKAWLYLDCPENDFQGGVTLHGPNNRLVLANDGALPANGGPLKMTDSSVAFPANVATEWSLPALELAGTSSVGNCQGNWKDVTALTGADATYNSALGASNLVLKSGAKLTVKSLFDRATYAGWEERYDLDHSTTDIAALPLVATKLSPDYFENDNFKWLADSNGANKTGTRTIAYATYIWNNGASDVTWTFAGHFGAHVYIWLNGQQILALTAGNAWRNPYRATGTLHPGANRLIVLSDNCSWGATSDTNSGNDIGTWAGVKTKGFAYAVGDVPLTECSDFSIPTDPGDGSFCTTKCGDSAVDGIAWSPAFQNLALEPGSILDLDGGTLTVETATGAGTVTNGTLVVTRALLVDPGVFEPGGGIVLHGDLVLGEGAKVVFPTADAHRRQPFGLYTLAIATGSVSGFAGTSMLDVGGQQSSGWAVRLSADGKTLSLERIWEGSLLLLQ